jgi:hypothetical protein
MIDDSLFDAAFEQTALRCVQAAAEAAAEQLSINVQRGRRTGRKYPNLPYISSAPGEYPQEQSSESRRSIGAELEADGVYLVGYHEAPAYVFYLEGLLPDGGAKLTELGVRYPVTRTMESPDTQRRMAEAIRRESR